MRHDRIIFVGDNWLKCQHIAGLSILEKVFNSQWLETEKIIVEVYEFFRQTVDFVKQHLNCVAVKCRQILVWNIILVIHDVKFGILDIQPIGQMSPGYKMNGSYPGSKFFYAPEPIPQQFPIAIPFIPVITFRFCGITLLFGAPRRICTIYPSNYKIYRFFNIHFFYTILSENPNYGGGSSYAIKDKHLLRMTQQIRLGILRQYIHRACPCRHKGCNPHQNMLYESACPWLTTGRCPPGR